MYVMQYGYSLSLSLFSHHFQGPFFLTNLLIMRLKFCFVSCLLELNQGCLWWWVLEHVRAWWTHQWVHPSPRNCQLPVVQQQVVGPSSRSPVHSWLVGGSVLCRSKAQAQLLWVPDHPGRAHIKDGILWALFLSHSFHVLFCNVPWP